MGNSETSSDKKSSRLEKIRGIGLWKVTTRAKKFPYYNMVSLAMRHLDFPTYSRVVYNKNVIASFNSQVL